MNSEELIKSSKFLSYVLRHKPSVAKVTLDENGWCNVWELISNTNLTFDVLCKVVESNNKKRFEFDGNRNNIRARQGHSVKVDLGYDPVQPPKYLYHGTATKNLDGIYKNGIKSGNRHDVHLSSNKKTAINVGSRHGKPVVIRIRAVDMQEDGHKFYVTENKVWLTDHVPVEYIHVVDFK